MIRTVEIRTTVPYLIETASWLTDSKITGGLVSTGDHRASHSSSLVGALKCGFGRIVANPDITPTFEFCPCRR